MTDLAAAIRAELSRVMDGYRPWDQEIWLGEPPWMPDDPRLVAWEEAHGHDPRLKCYPEFGCLVEWKEYLYPHVKLAIAMLGRHYPARGGHDCACGHGGTDERYDPQCPELLDLAAAWEVEV